MSDDDSDISKCINHLFLVQYILFVNITYIISHLYHLKETRESRSCERRKKMQISGNMYFVLSIGHMMHILALFLDIC
jgi:hypothetical protein